jgi:hypothetical protein
MKKLFALLAFIPLAASAEPLNPGTFELSSETNLSLLSQSTELKANGQSVSGDQTNWNLRGLGLYYIAPGVGIGGTLSYQSESMKFGDFVDSDTSTLTIGPAIGADLPIAPQVSAYGRASLVYAQLSANLGLGNGNVNSSGFGFGLEGGIKYFVVKAVSLDAGVGFQYLNLSGDVDTTSTGFGVNFGLSVYFGRI